jgi:hypothetical protein
MVATTPKHIASSTFQPTGLFDAGQSTRVIFDEVTFRQRRKWNYLLSRAHRRLSYVTIAASVCHRVADGTCAISDLSRNAQNSKSPGRKIGLDLDFISDILRVATSFVLRLILLVTANA